MKQTLSRLKKYGIGTRAMTEDDFHLICEAERIKVEWSKENVSFYLFIPETDSRVICLPKRFKGVKLLFAMFHELAHHFMHPGKLATYAFMDMEGSLHDRNEVEADACALVAMMPIDDIQKHAFFDGSRFGCRKYNERVRLFFLHGV